MTGETAGQHERRVALAGHRRETTDPGRQATRQNSTPSPHVLHLITTQAGDGPRAKRGECRGEELALGLRLRHRSSVAPGVTPVVRTRKSHVTGLARTLRTRWWPRGALTGAVLAVIGAALFQGAAQAGIVLLGMAVFLVAVLHGLGVHDRAPVNAEQGRHQVMLGRSSDIGSRREPPRPADENGPG